MKRVLSLLILSALLLTSCGNSNSSNVKSESKVNDSEISNEDYTEKFNSINDQELNQYIEDAVYVELVNQINEWDTEEEYYVESVDTAYISQEYIDELTYNSQSNIFFGYNLADLDEDFSEKYVFSLGEEGETIIRPVEEYVNEYEAAIKNVAMGSGVILVCVTVSVATGGVGTGAITIVFAEAAASGAVCAGMSGAIAGTASAIVAGIKTKNMNEAVKSGLIGASEGFKCGAIIGAVTGSVSGVGIVNSLKKVDTGVSLWNKYLLQKKVGIKPEDMKYITTDAEAKKILEIGLKSKIVNGKAALIRDIDLNLVDDKGRTNLERMKKGLAAIDKNGKSFELHHMGQESDGTLAILSQEEHDVNEIWHVFKDTSEINRTEFATTKKNFWKDMARILTEG